MGKFLAGIILGVLGVAAGAYAYVHNGYFDMRADQPMHPLERLYMRGAMDNYASRYSPKAHNPILATDANLIEGLKLYKSNCAGCHGGPDKPISDVGAGFSPRAPQFLKDAPEMPENQNYWIIQHGVKMTGMPAWDRVLSDTEIWKVTTFLGKMEDLDKLSPAVQQAWKTGEPAIPAASQNPAAATPPPQAAPISPKVPRRPGKHGH